MKTTVKEQDSRTLTMAAAKTSESAANETSSRSLTASQPFEPLPSATERRTAPQAEQVCFEWNFPNAKQVFIAGSFNNWAPNATPLKNCGAGRWLLNMAIKPGRYEYRFVVDGQWTDDPESEGCGPNPRGGRNSIMVV
jgi:1,4-alpha-glucan branching enzyme